MNAQNNMLGRYLKNGVGVLKSLAISNYQSIQMRM